jgi:hypothetical protein
MFPDEISSKTEPLLREYKRASSPDVESLRIEEPIIRRQRSKTEYTEFCEIGCMDCTQCCSAIAECCKNFAEKTAACLGESYPLIIRPTSSGIGHFFQDRNQRYTLYRPLIDTAWYSGNPLKMIAEAVLPVNPKTRRWSVPLLPVTYYRLKEFLQLLIHPIQAPKNTATALLAASLAMYTSLELMCAMHCALGSEHGTQFSFNPYTVIQQLANDRPEAWQKAVLALTGYIGALNGYLLGKDLPNDLIHWWKALWADVHTDNFDRHLKNLHKLYPDAASAAQENYRSAVDAGKNWKVVDVAGRALERALWLPSVIFQLPRTLAEKVTIPNKFAKKENTLSLAPSDYRELLRNQREQYSPFAPQNIRSIKLFRGEDQTTWRQRRQNEEMVQHFLAEVTHANLLGDAYRPRPPYGVTIPPTNEKWQENASDDEILQAMLRGKIRNRKNPREGLAFMFFNHLYEQHYCRPSTPTIQRQRAYTMYAHTGPTGHCPTPSPSPTTPILDILHIDPGPEFQIQTFPYPRAN